MAIEAGRVLSQRYRLIRPVGQGSQASVWVAEHLALTTHVAVKLIDMELAKKDSARERFRREATAAAQLRSAHVVQILDHGIDGDQPFIVMELLDGEDLFERLAHRTRLSLRETSKIVTQVGRALSRAHAAGIVHRDLKPENVFLVPNEDDEVVKVLDFGVAKVKDAAKVTMQKTGVGTLIGTPHYMSPEQVKGIVEVDYRSDLWALGVIAFQCVTGELPYDSEGVGDLLIKITIGELPVPSSIYPGVAPSFDGWFAKACARAANDRFQSAREMALALAGLVNAIDGVVPRAPTVRPSPMAVLPAIMKALPGPPRVPQAVAAPDTGELEEIDSFDEDEDDRPTRMKPPDAATSATRSLRAAPAPQVRSMSGTAVGLAPPRPGGSKPSTAPGPTPTPAPRAAARPVKSPLPKSPPPRTSALPPSDAHESHDIVDFDETIPATASHLAEAGFPLPLVTRAKTPPVAAALTPLSEPPRPLSPPPPAVPPAPASHRQHLDVAPQAVIGPVVSAPARLSAPQDPPPSAPRAPPRPPPAPEYYPPPSVTRPTLTEPEPQSHQGVLLADDDAEFDGSSKRRRMVRVMVAGLVLFAVGITWTVVSSQYNGSSGVAGPPSATAPTPTPNPIPNAARPPPPMPPDNPPPTTTAVDPGKVSRPTKPTPSGVKRGPLRPRQRPADDGTINIPDPPPDDGTVPPAP